MGDLVLETYFAFSWGYQSTEGKGGEGGGVGERESTY